MASTTPKLIWSSEYTMPAQCGDSGAADAVYVAGFSDGTVTADYSPWTGKEINKDFASAAEAADWFRNFFRDDDWTAESDFDFLTDLDDAKGEAE